MTAGKIVKLMRLDYFSDMLNKLSESDEISEIIGSPETHLAVGVENNRLVVRVVTPEGEDVRRLSPNEQRRVREITQRIIDCQTIPNLSLPDLR